MRGSHRDGGDPSESEDGGRGAWIVLEPTLGEWIGHQRGLVEALPELALRRGRAVRVFASTAAPPELVARHGVVPLFRLRPLPAWVAGDHAMELARLIQSSQEIAEDLLGRHGPTAGAADLVLLPTAYPWLMLAVASWLRRMPSASRPRLAVLIHEGHGLFAPPGHPPTVDQAAIMLGVSALTSVVPLHRLLVAATSDELADATARALGRPVPVVPVANPVSRLAPAVPAERRTTPSGAIRVALPGVPRPGKNARLLPAVIAAIRTAAADASILAQVGAKHAPDGDDAMVDLRPGALAEDDYRDMLTNAAIAVLPYDRAHYRARVSGIFVEAAAAGCVMVVPAGTWMADQLEAGRAAGIVVGDPTPDTIAAAVARAIAELPALSATAFAKSAQWREGYGPGPFIARIEELMDGPTGGGPASSA